MLDRAKIVDEQFIERVQRKDFPPARSDTTPLMAGLNKQTALSLFDSQIKSRLLDIIARELKEQNLSFYTIGSSGHEGNAAIAEVFRPQDMAFLHYRSGAFYLQRAKQVAEGDGINDILLSLVTAAADPCSGGRHKVFGSVPLFIPPQTSTIASHLPKALGAALSIARAHTLHHQGTLAQDAVILCSFGDASVNHASAQTTFNSGAWLASQNYPLPIVFICEDNGIGISVPTPKHWIKNGIACRPHLHYLTCDGLNIADVFLNAQKAQYLARIKKQPVFLHMNCVRLLGHAGSDIQSQYLSQQQIEAMEASDPLLHTARLMVQENWLSLEEIVALYRNTRALIESQVQNVLTLPKLS